MNSTPQNQSSEVYTRTVGESNFLKNLKIYLITPLSLGLGGFATFFSLIIFTKLFSYILGISDTFSLDLNDVILSLTGFVFAAGSKFFEFFSNEEN